MIADLIQPQIFPVPDVKNTPEQHRVCKGKLGGLDGDGKATDHYKSILPGNSQGHFTCFGKDDKFVVGQQE